MPIYFFIDIGGVFDGIQQLTPPEEDDLLVNTQEYKNIDMDEDLDEDIVELFTDRYFNVLPNGVGIVNTLNELTKSHDVRLVLHSSNQEDDQIPIIEALQKEAQKKGLVFPKIFAMGVKDSKKYSGSTSKNPARIESRSHGIIVIGYSSTTETHKDHLREALIKGLHLTQEDIANSWVFDDGENPVMTAIQEGHQGVIIADKKDLSRPIPKMPLQEALQFAQGKIQEKAKDLDAKRKLESKKAEPEPIATSPEFKEGPGYKAAKKEESKSHEPSGSDEVTAAAEDIYEQLPSLPWEQFPADSKGFAASEFKAFVSERTKESRKERMRPGELWNDYDVSRRKTLVTRYQKFVAAKNAKSDKEMNQLNPSFAKFFRETAEGLLTWEQLTPPEKGMWETLYITPRDSLMVNPLDNSLPRASVLSDSKRQGVCNPLKAFCQNGFFSKRTAEQEKNAAVLSVLDHYLTQIQKSQNSILRSFFMAQFLTQLNGAKKGVAEKNPLREALDQTKQNLYNWTGACLSAAR